MPSVQHKVNTRWTGDLAFESSMNGHTIVIDAGENADSGSWPSPKRLLLSGLAGCTGYDVVDLLRKMRVPFTGLEMDTVADLTDEHPKVYSEIRLIYRFFGKNLDKKKVEKAVKLSQEKYCGVTAMLAKNCPVVCTIEYANVEKVNQA